MLAAAAVTKQQASFFTLDADAAALIALMTGNPNATRQNLINDFFVGCKADGTYTLIDELWFPAALNEHDGLLGWKLYKNCTSIGAAAFEPDRGVTGAAGKYWTTNLTPSLHGVQYTLNSASFGVYCRTDGALNGLHGLYPSPGNTKRTIVLPRSAGGTVGFDMNGPSTSQISVAVASSLGLSVSERNAVNSVTGYRNGAVIVSGAGASDGMDSSPLYLLAVNTDGTPSYFDTRQYSAAFLGASLGATKQANLFTRIETYLDAIGAGVVA